MEYGLRDFFEKISPKKLVALIPLRCICEHDMIPTSREPQRYGKGEDYSFF